MTAQPNDSGVKLVRMDDIITKTQNNKTINKI